jgi:AcrR family transcriptional regulator
VARTPTQQVRAGAPKWQTLAAGTPARQRGVRDQGRKTADRLLQAGLEEFNERGFHALHVDDVVRRAQTSHGTFYLYFSGKEELFKTLLATALREMQIITAEFPLVTRNMAGREALQGWVRAYCEAYAKNAAVMRVLSQDALVDTEFGGDGLQSMFRLAEAITAGMTAGLQDGLERRSDLTAIACAVLLERVNFLLSIGVIMPKADLEDRLSAIIYSAFTARSPAGTQRGNASHGGQPWWQTAAGTGGLAAENLPAADVVREPTAGGAPTTNGVGKRVVRAQRLADSRQRPGAALACHLTGSSGRTRIPDLHEGELDDHGGNTREGGKSRVGQAG